MRSFPLAPMSPLIVALTATVLAIPVVFGLTGLWAGNALLLRVAVLIAAGCLLVWPMRRQLIRAREIARVRPIEPWELRQEVGLGVRIGVGGLWGQFGWFRALQSSIGGMPAPR